MTPHAPAGARGRRADRLPELAHPRRWLWRRATAALRALPDFVIIGAQRSGTTSTYAYLVQHPRIEAAWHKEVHYFDSPRNYRRGPGWYRAHFPLRRPGRITGEATPEYLLRAKAPARLAALVPRARLVALLRNPVDRAVSHYHHHVRQGRETRPLERALAEQRRTLPTGPWSGESYLIRGLYAEQLETVLRAVPREQVLVLLSEELFARPEETVARIVAFLGLPPHPIDVRGRLSAGRYEPMPPAVRAELIEFFRPHNARLADLLGRDLGWDR
jgi:hypothetical protein